MSFVVASSCSLLMLKVHDCHPSWPIRYIKARSILEALHSPTAQAFASISAALERNELIVEPMDSEVRKAHFF